MTDNDPVKRGVCERKQVAKLVMRNALGPDSARFHFGGTNFKSNIEIGFVLTQQRPARRRFCQVIYGGQINIPRAL